MTDTQKLLAEYAANGSETAFRELVGRYLGLVYGTALRLVGGDAPLAEDVTQSVFISLAAKARTLSNEVMLGGWLYQRACHLALQAMRNERRRQRREREALEMKYLHEDAEASWRQVAPILDEAIGQLGKADRAAILLRFFERCDFRLVGDALGTTEDAARMRVNRALEKLHLLLTRRGVTLSVAALGAMLAADTSTAVPAALAASVSTAALAGAAAGTGMSLTCLNLMTLTKLKLAVATLAIAGVTTVVLQHRIQAGLREENQALRQQIARLTAGKGQPANRPVALRLPAPPVQVSAVPEPSLMEAASRTGLMARLTNDLKLTAGQVEPYLQANRRNAASLLAAYGITGDAKLLEEAMQKYPGDARVALQAAGDKGLSPEQRRQWLNTFEQTDAQNALPNYLSALDYFKAGKTDDAVQQLIAASGKPQFVDYRPERVQDTEELLSAAGYSPAEAKALAAYNTSLIPSPKDLRALGLDLVGLANSYRQAGDEASAQTALQLAEHLGQQYAAGTSPSEPLINEFGGINIQLAVLGTMDPASPYGDKGQTVQDQINQLTQLKAAVRAQIPQLDLLMQKMTDQDWINYCDRISRGGEKSADQWLMNKFGQP